MTDDPRTARSEYAPKPKPPMAARPVASTVDEAIEDRMSQARDLDEPELTTTAQGMDASDANKPEAVAEPPHNIQPAPVNDFAVTTANKLDIASNRILDRINGIRERCDRIEQAVMNDFNFAKLQIHATINLGSRAETLVQIIDNELTSMVAERKNAVKE